MHFNKTTKYLILICIFLTIAVSCKKETFDIYNLNGNTITIIGHGGMGIKSSYPMNSYESISNCLHLGADGSEMDVQMTKDSVLVVFHDKELSTKTNIPGVIHEKTWDELRNATYNQTLYTNYKVVNLETIFSGLKNIENKLFVIDFKDEYNPDTTKAYRNRFCNAILNIIDKYNMEDNVIIELSRPDLIEPLRKLRPNLKIYIYTVFHYALELAQKHNLQGIVLSLENITDERISIAHAHGIKISAFNTTSNKKNIEAIKYNVDMIETDELKHLLKTLR